LRPGDAGYAGGVQLYDSRYDGVQPAGLATCASTSDVQRCVAFARDHGLAPIPRGGGHSYGGYSTGPGLVIDTGGMGAVAVSAPGTATVGAGARLIDVYGGLNARGVSIPAGSCPTVGIAGLALGGGAGVVDRAHGLTCDAMTAVEVVTADGTVHQASADGDDANLFWACQGGGGGNFGIATSFSFRTFAISDVAIFSLSWPWEAAEQVLPAWLQWIGRAPAGLWSNLLLVTDPAAGAPSVHVGGVVSDGSTTSAVDTQIDRLVAQGGGPSSRSVEQTSFAHAMLVEAGCSDLTQQSCRLTSQGGSLPRQPSLAKSDYLHGPLGDAGVGAVLAGIDGRRATGGYAAVGYDSLGQAVNAVAPDATAFVHRTSVASAQYNVDFTPGTSTSALATDQAFLDGWYASLRPYVSGEAYQNYIDPNLSDWAQAYYGSNLPRLSRIKASYDPDDTFRFAQSIPLPG
jgi:FAD/FMN-containing dehydrogenase